MVTCPMAQSPRPARCSKSGTNAEHNSGCKRYEGEDRCGPGQRGSGSARNDRGHGRVDRVHEPKPAGDETAGSNEADYAGSQGDKNLQHIEFPEREAYGPLQYETYR